MTACAFQDQELNDRELDSISPSHVAMVAMLGNIQERGMGNLRVGDNPMLGQNGQNGEILPCGGTLPPNAAVSGATCHCGHVGKNWRYAILTHVAPDFGEKRKAPQCQRNSSMTRNHARTNAPQLLFPAFHGLNSEAELMGHFSVIILILGSMKHMWEIPV